LTVDAVDKIPHSALIYDCVDRHSAYGGLMNPALVDAMELELAKKADVVFATAEALAARLRAVNPKTYFIPNGANYERFVQASQPQPTPEDMKSIPGPIFGFVGALQPCIQYDYVEYAAKKKPEWSFVWIGKEKPGAQLGGLRELKNVHFLGMKPNEALPPYLAHFDACLNLFAAGDLSKDVSPLKFYEYLATGKPIVSTRQPDQILQYAPLIEIADSPEQFVSACGRALEDRDPERAARRAEEGKKSSWDSRVAEMRGILRDEGVF
jgi:glycosyltransferase involved in cell wall biosynthesis